MFQNAKHTMHWLRCGPGVQACAGGGHPSLGVQAWHVWQSLRFCCCPAEHMRSHPLTVPPFPSCCSECARLIAKEGHGVMWHTPLGLPVVQPYRRKDRQHVRTLLQVGSRDAAAPTALLSWQSTVWVGRRWPNLPAQSALSCFRIDHTADLYLINPALLGASHPLICSAWCWWRTTTTCPS